MEVVWHNEADNLEQPFHAVVCGRALEPNPSVSVEVHLRGEEKQETRLGGKQLRVL
jgi:hypothetical protein